MKDEDRLVEEILKVKIPEWIIAEIKKMNNELY